jgi:hypothetical protein
VQKRHGARDAVIKDQLHLGTEVTFYEALGQTVGLEIVKLAAWSSMRIRKMSVKASWRRMMVVHLDRLEPSLGKGGETDHRRHKH